MAYGKVGRIAKRKARKAYRTAVRKPKRTVAKLYAAKVGKSVYNRLSHHKKHKKHHMKHKFHRKHRMHKHRHSYATSNRLTTRI